MTTCQPMMDTWGEVMVGTHLSSLSLAPCSWWACVVPEQDAAQMPVPACPSTHVCTSGARSGWKGKGKARLDPPAQGQGSRLEHSMGHRDSQDLILAGLITAGHACQLPRWGWAHADRAQLQPPWHRPERGSWADGCHKAPSASSPPFPACPARGQLKVLFWVLHAAWELPKPLRPVQEGDVSPIPPPATGTLLQAHMGGPGPVLAVTAGWWQPGLSGVAGKAVPTGTVQILGVGRRGAGGFSVWMDPGVLVGAAPRVLS